MDLHRQLAIVRARLPLLIASVVLAGGAAFAYFSLQPKVYEAKATLIVGQSLSGVTLDFNQLLVSQRLSSTYASVATTRPILDKVIKELGLAGTAHELSPRVQAAAAVDSALLTISAQDGDPDRAAALANTLAEELIAASPAVQGRQVDVQKSVDEDLKATQVQIKATQAQVEELMSLPERTPKEEAALETLQGRLVSLRSTYATLLSFSSTSATNLLTIVQPAVAPLSPVSPRPLFNTLLAGMVGLLIASAIVFIAEYLNDTVKDSDDVQEVAGLPTLGTIVRMKGDAGRREIYRLVTILYPRSQAAEAYRTLRANIEFSSVDAPIRTLLITSPGPGDGKTVTAANLAIAFAQSGLRVLLVDADLRRPGLDLIFDVPNAPGLTSLLRSDEMSLDAIAHATEQENLRVLPTGPLPPNPTELLGSKRMRAVMDRLQAGSDLVVVDSPPLQAVADAAILSSFLDGTLLVVGSGGSRRSAVRQGREALAKAGARVLGVVLNRVSQRGRVDYSGYYSADAEAASGARATPSG